LPVPVTPQHNTLLFYFVKVYIIYLFLVVSAVGTNILWNGIPAGGLYIAPILSSHKAHSYFSVFI